jgi:hypothetical protein
VVLMVVLRGVSYCYMYSAAYISKVRSRRKRWQAVRDKEVDHLFLTQGRVNN